MSAPISDSMSFATKSNQTRTTFVSLKKMDGERYLFLEPTNLIDLHLIQQIEVERSHLKAFGKKEKGLELFATNVTNTKIGLA